MLPVNIYAINIKDSFGDETGKTLIQTTGYKSGDLFFLLSVIIKNLYMVSGVILLFFILAGGVGTIINAGDPEKLKKSNKTLSSAVLGFGIMFTAYWIIKIIEIITGVAILSL